MHRCWTAGFGIGALVLALAAPTAGQETGGVAGRVMDGASLRPLAGAQVFVEGLDRGAIADARGRYRIEDLPAGAHTLRAVLIGYEADVTEVTVTAGAVADAGFRLVPSAISLEAIVATTTGERRKKTLSNSVTRVDADRLTSSAPIAGLHDLIQGRAAGVSVLPSTGTVGGGARIRMRGSGSIALHNDPVVYVDGVRIESSESSLSVPTGGQRPSRLDDINPEDIESIEIVRGPSAATLYGTDGANGVIRIRTKRGRVGTARWQVWTQQGVLEDRHEFPANIRAFAADGRACPNPLAAAGLCTQARVQSFNPLEDERTSPFELGRRQSYGASLSGGSDRLHYYLSGEYEREDGVFGLPPSSLEALRDQFGDELDELDENQFDPNALRRINLRGNFGGQVMSDLSLRVSTGYVSSDLNLPQNDDTFFGVIPSGMLGASSIEEGLRGYAFVRPEESFAIDVEQEVERFTGSLGTDYRPGYAGWLSVRATLGMDVTHRTDIEDVPRGRITGFNPEFRVGRRQVNQARIFHYSADVSATATADLSRSVRSRTTVGGQWWRKFLNRSDATGIDIPAGPSSIGAAARTRADETTLETITLGVFVEQQLSVGDRLFLNGAIRGDDNSAFGSDFDFVLYPKAGLSYVVSEDPWFPDVDFLSSLRLRAAWGKSGKQPGPSDALQTFRAIAIAGETEESIGVTLDQFGNVDLEPEQSSEIEAGFDAALFEDRLNVQLTYYDKRTTDLLIEQPLPLSAGVGTARLVNLGKVTNTGVELALKLIPLRSESVSWDLTVIASTNDNELEELGDQPSGEPLAPFLIGGGTQRAVEGFPLFGYWDRPVRFDDTNGDGRLSVDEVSVGEDEVFLDEALPTREASIGTTLTLFDLLQLSARLDHRGGHSLRNSTAHVRCIFGGCRALFDDGASLEHQAAAIAGILFPPARRSQAGFIEDASFWKLRELGLTFFIPRAVSRRFGADRATLSLTGRNLKTWTDYSGLDPEVNARAQANFLSFDFFTQPPVTRWTARLTVGF